MKRIGCRFCSIKARRRCCEWRDKILFSALIIAITALLGHYMPDSSTVTKCGVLLDVLFYLSVILNAGWFFYLFSPLVRRRIFNAVLFMGLFVWGCVLYYCSPVDDSNRSTAQIERQIEAPNRTVAAFFPSRGGFETVANGGGSEKMNSNGKDVGKTPSNDNGFRLRLHYFIFHTSVLFYVALITFSIFGRGIVNNVRKWVTSWWRLNVFWGRSNASLLLARNITETTVDDQVFFMLQQKSGDGDEWRTLTQDIDNMDAMWAFAHDSNTVETDVSRDTLAQTKGRRHFFLDESGHVNVSRADRLVTVLRTKKLGRGLRGFCSAVRAGVLRWWLRGCPKPFFYVRVEASTDELIFQRWAAGVRDVVTPVLIRESQLIAKYFIQRYPLLKAPGVEIDEGKAVVAKGEFKILILGFGAAGQDILNELVCNGQFLNAEGKVTPFSVDVVERDPDVVKEYCIRRPLVCKCNDESIGFDIRFHDCKVEEKEFDDWFKGSMKTYNRIVVCLNGDDKTLAIANKVVEFARRHGVCIPPNVVYARVTDPARNRYVKIFSLFDRGAPRERDRVITLFGNLSDIYSFNRIDVEVVDTMAKVLNSRHGDFGRELSDPKQMEKDWENASFFDQLSSRAAAEGQRNLLLLRKLDYLANVEAPGFREISFEEVDAPMTDESFKRRDSILRTLSVDEHLRWNAFHLMMGYRPWNILDRKSDQDPDARNDIPAPRPKRIKANQLATIGKHADIVEFDRLPDVDIKLKEWDTGKTLADLNMERKDFEGLTPDSAQAWDVAFCQIIGKAADAAGQTIVKTIPSEA